METAALSIRALHAEDLDTVVAIDAALQGRRRHRYIERRLAAARREPALHAQLAAVDAQGLAGYILGRVLVGEFGRTVPGLRLELIGVRDGVRREGIGARLFDALLHWARRHGIGELRTGASWRDTTMLRWFDRQGFELAPMIVLAQDVAAARARSQVEGEVSLDTGRGPGREVDFGSGESNDFERGAREAASVRVMRPDDLPSIVRIDRAITGRDRSDYLGARLTEAMDDAGVRVSLAAVQDGAVVGFLMARADLGDFGRTEPVAILDTLGVDPEYGHRGVGHALLVQLFEQLHALHIDSVETLVHQRDLGLLGFLQDTGFGPSPRLAFGRAVESAA